MKRIILSFFLTFCYGAVFSQADLLAPVAPLFKNITRIVIWGSEGDGINHKNILRFGAGISIVPTPASVRDTTNVIGDTIQLEGKLYIGTLSPVIDTVKNNMHKFKRVYTLLNVDPAREKAILARISNHKKRVEDHCSISLGYENIQTQVKVDSAISSPPISGFYIGGFYTTSFFKKELPFTVGATIGLFTISNGTANLGPSYDPFPVKYSSSTTVSPELYLGTSFFKGILFIEVSYKYLKFNAITYTPANTGVLSQTEYVMLPTQVNLSSYHFTLGLSIPLNFSDFAKK